MTDGMDYKQFQKFYDNFSKINEEFEDWLKKFLLQQAQRCIARTKTRQRSKGFIDTGYMINSWVIGDEAKGVYKGEKGKGNAYVSAFSTEATIDSVKKVGNNFEVMVGNIADYSSYVEYGHSLKNGGWFNGGFMLTISIDEVERAMPKRFESAFLQFVKERGIG